MAARDELKRADVFIAEVSHPSTGQGIELGLASTAEVPIICFYRSGTKPSSSLRFVTDNIIEYVDIQDLIGRLQKELSRIA